MVFCPNCGKLLLKTNDGLKCNKCNYGKNQGPKPYKRTKPKDPPSKPTYILSKSSNSSSSRPKTVKKEYRQEDKHKITSFSLESFIENKQRSNNERSNSKTARSEIRDKSPDNIEAEWQKYFPYLRIRKQQQEIIEEITLSAKSGNHVIVQAANGVGKTISVLSALLPISKEKGKTIVYCCRTHEQMARVIDELKLIQQLSKVSGITLKGRKQLCLHPIIKKFAVDSANASDICRFLKKDGKCQFFSNLANRNLMSDLEEHLYHYVLDSDELLEIGQQYEVCPFELSKKFLKDTNVVAASYQYLFNPSIQNSFLTALEKSMHDLIVVVDEAHNLPSTAVDINTTSLSAFSLNNAMSEANRFQMGTEYDILDSLYAVLEEETHNIRSDEEIPANIIDFLEKVENKCRLKIDERFINNLEGLGEMVKEQQSKRNKAPLAYSSAVARFLSTILEIRERGDYAYFYSVYETTQNRIPKIISQCLDPRVVTEEVLLSVYMSVSMSGTLDPIDSYISLTGLPKKSKFINLPSPYDNENIQALVIQKVSSKLKDRTPQNYQLIINTIEAVVKATPKNVGIFCASYSVIDDLLNHGLEKAIANPMYIAYRGMSSQENDEMIQEFKDASQGEGGVLLSVLGGRSSEGSDYPAEQMHSVIIVGIPYARPTPSVQASIEYLEKQFPKKGREYGYVLPALIRASQAAGRPIRGLEDYATIVLCDYRFAWSYYRKHLPSWLTDNMRIVQPDQEIIEKKLKEFFSHHQL